MITAWTTEGAAYVVAMERVRASVTTVTEPVSTCPRCGHASVRGLGNAHSSLEWYHCRTCDHVWAARIAMASATRMSPRTDEAA